MSLLLPTQAKSNSPLLDLSVEVRRNKTPPSLSALRRLGGVLLSLYPLMILVYGMKKVLGMQRSVGFLLFLEFVDNQQMNFKF